MSLNPIFFNTVGVKKKEPDNTIRDLFKTRKVTGFFLAQPYHTPLDSGVVGNKSRLDYLVDQAISELRSWGVPKVIADKKYKGVRMLIYIDKPKGIVRIYSRRGKQTYEKFKNKFYKELLKNAPDYPVMLDGEMIIKEGYKTYQGDINGWMRDPEEDYTPQYMVFDILHYRDYDVRKLPLKTRRELLKKVIKPKGMFWLVDSRTISLKDKTALKEFFKQALKDSEGLVIKDPEQPYMQDKGGGLHWLKLKYFETPDLELKRVEAHPRDKPFRFYKHWVLVPADAENHEIAADKGFDGMGFDWDFYIDFTKEILRLADQNKVKASKETVPVDPHFVSIYGRRRVPKSITLPKRKRLIVEILCDDISKDLIPVGQKILGIRYDKERGDNLSKLKTIREILIRKG